MCVNRLKRELKRKIFLLFFWWFTSSVFCDMQWLEFCRGGLWALGWFFCYVCLQGGFWLQIHASFCHGSKASVFPSNCWELGWRDLICHCWSKRLKCHQNEIKSDQIELELCLHTLLLFSSPLPVLFSLVLIPPPPFHLPPHFSTSLHLVAQTVNHLQKWFTDAKR